MRISGSFTKQLFVIAICFLFLFSCTKENKSHQQILGTFAMTINPVTGETYFTPAFQSPIEQIKMNGTYSNHFDTLNNLGWENSINMSTCDPVLGCTQRILPVNCANADYNSASGILTATARLFNATSPGGEACDSRGYCSETFLSPIELRMWSLEIHGVCDTVANPTCDLALLITGSLLQSEVTGINHDTGCDSVIDGDADEYLDCLLDDPHFVYTEPNYDEYELHPTWDYTGKCDVNTSSPPQALDPDEYSGCKFLQITWTDPGLDNTHIPVITAIFDVLAYVQGVGLNVPTVAPATTPTRLSSQDLTVTIDTGNSADTVKVTGGAAEVVCADNDPCDSNGTAGTVVVTVNLNTNQLNNIYVYQLDTGPDPDITSPGTYVPIKHDDIALIVNSVIPAPSAVNISPATNILVSFNEPFDPSTITTTTILLYQGTTPITGTVTPSVDGYTATFDPSVNLTGSTLYDVTVKGGTLPCTDCVKDIAGNSLASDYTSQFTTASTDTTPPTIQSTQPPDNASGVSLNTTVQINFSEYIDVNSLTSPNTNITVQDGSTTIVGDLSLSVDGETAYFVPNDAVNLITADEFDPSTEYTVTIDSGSDGIKDLAGNFLQVDYVFVFTTGAGADTTRPEVVGSTPANNAADVSEYITPEIIFTESIDPTTLISGNLYIKKKVDESIITSTTTQSSDGITVWVNPSGALESGVTYVITIGELIADMAGNTLLDPQTVQFTTAAAPDTTNPTVNTVTPVDNAKNVSPYTGVVVSFSEPVDANSVSTATIIVEDTDASSTVSGSVRVSEDGLSATFSQLNPPLNRKNNHQVTIKGGTLPCTCIKDRAGNPLAADFVTTFLTAWDDTVDPYVVSVIPEDGSTAVPLNINIIARFSEPINPDTINDTTMYLTIPPSTTHIAGTLKLLTDGVTAQFNPTDDLTASTTYRLTTTVGIQDLGNRNISAGTETDFTTGTVQDSTGPTVSSFKSDSKDPLNDETGVGRWENVYIYFNEYIDPSTVTVDSIELIRDFDSSRVPANITVADNALSIIINSVGLLQNYDDYTVKVKTGIRNLSGLSLQNYSETGFKTEDTSADTTPPTVSSHYPAEGEQVDPTVAIMIYMSESIDPDNAVEGIFRLDRMSGGVAHPHDGILNISLGDSQAGDANHPCERCVLTIDPEGDLKKNSDFRFTVTTDVVDDADNNMSADYIFNFTAK